MLSDVVVMPKELEFMERDLIRAGVKYGIARMNGGFALLRAPVRLVRQRTKFAWDTVTEVLTGDPFLRTGDVEIEGWHKPFRLHERLN